MKSPVTHLVGGLEHVLFFHILGIIIPTDSHFFQRGRYTTNQYCYPDFDELRPHHVCCLKATTPGIQLVLWGATGRLGDVGYKQCIGLMKFNEV
jgi:hypothetical protein